jgi:type I restriction enzyme M protein
MDKKKKLGSVFDFACGSGSLILNVRKQMDEPACGKLSN